MNLDIIFISFFWLFLFFLKSYKLYNIVINLSKKLKLKRLNIKIMYKFLKKGGKSDNYLSFKFIFQKKEIILFSRS